MWERLGRSVARWTSSQCQSQSQSKNRLRQHQPHPRPTVSRSPRMPSRNAPQPFHGENEYPFAVGTVRGVRAWRVSYQGLLRPLHVTADPWEPGENHAQCMAGLAARLYPEMRRPGEHETPDENCKCGFYAYHEDRGIPPVDIAYAMMERSIIAGVIEGYGRTLIGERGFRCEKARIVKLTPWDGHTSPEVVERVHQNYPDVPIEPVRTPTFTEVWAAGGRVTTTGPASWHIAPANTPPPTTWIPNLTLGNNNQEEK